MDQRAIMKTFLKGRNEELFEAAFMAGWGMPTQDEMLDLWRERVKADPDETMDEILDELIDRSSFEQRMCYAFSFYQLEAQNYLQAKKTIELNGRASHAEVDREVLAVTLEQLAEKVREGEFG